MEILKYGNKGKILSCGNCGCLFKYFDGDIKVERKHDRMGHVHFKRYLKCPQCGIELIMSK